MTPRGLLEGHEKATFPTENQPAAVASRALRNFLSVLWRKEEKGGDREHAGGPRLISPRAQVHTGTA